MATTNALLNQAIGAVNQSNSVSQSISKLLETSTAKLADMGTVNAAAGATAVAQAERAAGLQAGAEFTQREMARKTQDILNINPDVAENELQISTNALNAAQRNIETAGQKYMQNRAEYDSLAQKDFMTDPLGYVFAQLKLPSVAARVNSASDEQANYERMADSAVRNITARTGIAKAYNDTVVANTAGTLKEAALAKADAQSKLSQIQLSEAEMQNISRIGGMQMQRAQLANAMADDKVKVVNMQMQAAQTAASQEQAKAARDQANELRMARLAELKKETDYEARMDVQLAGVSKFLGMTTPLSYRSLKEFSPKLRDQLLSAAQSGTMGVDLVESMKNFTQIPGKGNIAATNPGVGKFVDRVSTSIQGYAETLQAAAAKTGQKVPAGQLGIQATEDYQLSVYSAAHSSTGTVPMSSATWDNTFNPYKAQHRVMLDEVNSGVLATLKNNEMVKALQTVATTAEPGREINAKEEDRALKIVRDRVAKRELLPAAAAAQIADYYRVAAGKNADFYQYSAFGMQPQSKYYFEMSAVGMLGNNIKADLMNPTSVERALLKDIRGAAQVSALSSPQPLIGVGGAAGAVGIMAGTAQMKLNELFREAK